MDTVNRLGWMALVAGLALAAPGCSEDEDDIVVAPPTETGPYVGAEVCGGCHVQVLADFLTSGHAQQFHPVTGGEPPVYAWQDDIPHPVTDPPPGRTWADIALVVGGHYGFAVFFGADGQLITGQDALWDVRTGTWSPYDPGQSAPYDCAGCHASGFDPDGEQTRYPALAGAWAQDGVTCEGCHGPGREHADSGRPEDIVVDGSNGFCFGCHRQRPGHPIPGFADVELGLSHPGDCTWCHDPHMSFRYDFARSTLTDCAQCHQADAPGRQTKSGGSSFPDPRSWSSLRPCSARPTPQARSQGMASASRIRGASRDASPSPK